MKKITNYCVVVQYTAVELSKSVQEGIVDGWQPFGSICMELGDFDTFTQAMVIYEKE